MEARPSAGGYSFPLEISLSTDSPDTLIYYTLNGDDPTQSDDLYDPKSNITIFSPVLIKAKAFRHGIAHSHVFTGTYTENTSVAAVTKPTISPPTRVFTGTAQVGISTATPGATIFSTIDGKTPTTSSSSSTSIQLTKTTRIRSAAYAGGKWSAITEEIFADSISDTDGDAMPDAWEIYNLCDPFHPDAHVISRHPYAHGLSNLQVYQQQTVLISDGYSTIGDSVPDWWKVKNGFSITTGEAMTAPNGFTLKECFRTGDDPNAPPGSLTKVSFAFTKGPEEVPYVIINNPDPKIKRYYIKARAHFADCDPVPDEISSGKSHIYEVNPTSSFENHFLKIPDKWAVQGSLIRYSVVAEDEFGNQSPSSGELSHRMELRLNSSRLEEAKSLTQSELRRLVRSADERPPSNGNWPYILVQYNASYLSCWENPFQHWPNEEYNNIGLFQGMVSAEKGNWSLLNAGINQQTINGVPRWTMANGYKNFFGLTYLGFLFEDYSNPNYNFVLNAGSDSAVPPYASYVGQKTAEPAFDTVNFWFATRDFLGNLGSLQKSPLILGSPYASIKINAFIEKNPAPIGTPVTGNVLVQTFFQNAFLCDAQTGDVPRTTELNIGEKMKINLSLASKKGLLSPLGSFTPSAPGKYILTTIPDEQGFYGEVTVDVIGLSADINQSGIIDEEDYSSTGFSFWANSDLDRLHLIDCGLDEEQDDLLITDSSLPLFQRVPDSDYINASGRAEIPSLRDLEDYTRLHLPGLRSLILNLPAGFTAQLEFLNKADTSNPELKMFKAVEPNGGRRYLVAQTTAEEQINNNLAPFVGVIGPNRSIDLNYLFSRVFPFGIQLSDYFIFCGKKTGEGLLAVKVRNQLGIIVQVSPFKVKISEIKSFYERWTVGETPFQEPMSHAIPSTGGGESFSYNYNALRHRTEKYVLHVHGWNMPTHDKEAFAETMFKRLYLSGYTGRFGSFQWPTGTGFDICAWQNPITTPNHYDQSEFIAWKSSTALRSLLTDLNAKYPSEVRLTAHSMGNIVAGEALRGAASPLVSHYVAMQAAVPACAYDATVPLRPISEDWLNDSTADLYRLFPNHLGKEYFSNPVGASLWINFPNLSDYALEKWELNQDLKPANTLGYYYLLINGEYKFLRNSTPLDELLDRWEIFSFGVEARSKALGSELAVGGRFDRASQLTLGTIGYGATKKDHSAQFRSHNVKSSLFYQTLVLTTELVEQRPEP